MRNALVRILMITGGVLLGAGAKAQELTFDEVWRSINGASKLQQASRYALEAAEEAKSRASRHWLPSLYANAKAYQTNDPGASFFALLSQRAVTAADFEPARLNHPEEHFYTRGAIGLDWPLFEGGMKISQVEMQSHLLAAGRHELGRAKVEQYSEAARGYGSLLALEQQKSNLVEMRGVLERLLKRYQLGSKANPLGYSGLLGIKTLSNRVSGLLAENESKTEANRKSLEEQGLKAEGWRPTSMDVVEFVNRFLPDAGEEESAALAARREKALAAENAVGMEKARYLPKIGAFAEEYVFAGNRRADNGYSAGLYLQWNLFHPSDYGAAKEARLNAAAAGSYAEAYAERERAEAKGLKAGIKALRENLRLMEESRKFLAEQTSVAEGLFRNGSINALQLTETLSRRTDLIISSADAQLELLSLGAERARKRNFQLPPAVSEVRR